MEYRSIQTRIGIFFKCTKRLQIRCEKIAKKSDVANVLA